MDISSYLTAASMARSHTKVKQQVNVMLLKTTINSAENNSAELLKVMEQSVQPHIGSKIDLKG